MLWRYSQVVRHGSAKAWSSVQIRLPPSQTNIYEPSNGLFWYISLIESHFHPFVSDRVFQSWKEKIWWKKLPYMLSASSLWPCSLLANQHKKRLIKENLLLAALKKPLKALRVLEVHTLKSHPAKRIFHQASTMIILIVLQTLTRARILTIQWAWWTKENH